MAAHPASKTGRPADACLIDIDGTPSARIAMIGDDADVGGARAAGLLGVAVRTGKFRPGDEAGADAVLDSIAELPRWLGI